MGFQIDVWTHLDPDHRVRKVNDQRKHPNMEYIKE
jgi:hypothetical protein